MTQSHLERELEEKYFHKDILGSFRSIATRAQYRIITNNKIIKQLENKILIERHDTRTDVFENVHWDNELIEKLEWESYEIHPRKYWIPMKEIYNDTFNIPIGDENTFCIPDWLFKKINEYRPFEVPRKIEYDNNGIGILTRADYGDLNPALMNRIVHVVCLKRHNGERQFRHVIGRVISSNNNDLEIKGECIDIDIAIGRRTQYEYHQVIENITISRLEIMKIIVYTYPFINGLR